MRLNHVYILIGSNVEPERNIPRTLEVLKQWFNIVAVSPIYESAAVGGAPGDAPYWNMAIQVESYTILLLLRRNLRALEHQLGRRRFDLEGERIKAVAVDLDILLYNNEVNRSVIEPLPHPDLLEHAYAAIPLADLAPHLPHPVTGEPIGEIAQRLRKGANLRRIDPSVRIEREADQPIAMLSDGDVTNLEDVSDAALPGDIPVAIDTLSPTLEALVTPLEVGSDVQPTPTVDMPASEPTKKRKSKKADPTEAPTGPTKPTKTSKRSRKEM
jgi:2-amino-4-hydroxy-6-hydroxymethyldihydropteridine diphosphokinase